MNYVKREIQETRFYSLLFMIMDSHKYIFGFKCEVYYEGGGPYSLSMMNYAKKKRNIYRVLANSMYFSVSEFIFT